ncbi:MAG: hypothetical protein LUC98_00655, partial [Lachnospiraceae bacterium]|nr:hypothetical protein [Lachnospiraceae bacterium]
SQYRLCERMKTTFCRPNHHMFDEVFKKLMTQFQRIKRNVQSLLYNNELNYITERLMYLFRETYADLAMLMLCGYSLQQYEESFEHALQFRAGSLACASDDYRQLRMMLVQLVMKNEKQKIMQANKLIDHGKETYDRFIGNIPTNNEPYGDGNAEKSRQITGNYVIVNQTIVICLLDYLYKCKEALDFSLKHMDDGRSKTLAGLKEKITDSDSWKKIV